MALDPDRLAAASVAVASTGLVLLSVVASLARPAIAPATLAAGGVVAGSVGYVAIRHLDVAISLVAALGLSGYLGLCWWLILRHRGGMILMTGTTPQELEQTAEETRARQVAAWSEVETAEVPVTREQLQRALDSYRRDHQACLRLARRAQQYEADNASE